MTLDTLFSSLFPQGHTIAVDQDFICGEGRTAAGPIAVIGSANRAPVGVELALQLSGAVLDIIRLHPGRPILLLISTQGQRLTRRDEMLGINSYCAHIAKCLHLARQRGHRLIGLIFDEAVSGGLLSFGMMADEVHGIASAEVRVMNLPAMSRVTRIPLERLEALSQSSPVFAPGISNYVRLGGVQSLWQAPLDQALALALATPAGPDLRRQDGLERGGRTLAAPVAQRVRASGSA